MRRQSGDYFMDQSIADKNLFYSCALTTDLVADEINCNLLESITITITITDPLAKPLKYTLLHFCHASSLWTLLFSFMVSPFTPSKFLLVLLRVDFIIATKKCWYNRKLFIMRCDRTIFKFRTFCDSHFIHFAKFCFVTSFCMKSEHVSHFLFVCWIRINKNENEPWNLYSLHITSISISIRKKTYLESYLLCQSTMPRSIVYECIVKYIKRTNTLEWNE